MLNFVLAESALELVPKEVRGNPSVVADSRRREVDSAAILLDRSFHHSAMLRLKDSEKRGRPDLVHVALLSVTGTPLYLDGQARIFVHTRDDVVLEIREKTRIPKNYIRFRGLMEKALVDRPSVGLVVFRDADLEGVVKRVARAELTVGLSVQGRPIAIEKLGEQLAAARDPCVVVGGFPRGHFAPGTLSVLDELVRIEQRPLEAHVVAARVVYEAEKAMRAAND